MSDVEVRSIELPRDAVAFVKSWWPIYADDPHWVPPLIPERKTFFDPEKNPYFKVADVQCYMAFRDGAPVGTIAATVDHKLQEHEPGVGLFGFFEFVADGAVAGALLDAAAAWLREREMNVARGPFNFSTNHEFGLLVDGFDTDPCVANPHNRDYYPEVYESIGLHKAMDWYAYWVDQGPTPEVIAKLAERIEKRTEGLTIRCADMRNYERDTQLMREIYNDAWERNWGHIELTGEEFDFISAGLKQIIDPQLCHLAFIDGEVAAASITLPDFNQVAKKMNGRIMPFGWWHFLFGKSKIDAFRIFILGVKHKYQKLGLGIPLYHRVWQIANVRQIRGAEASLILENNHRMRGALEKMGFRIYKTYRSYEMDLSLDSDHDET